MKITIIYDNKTKRADCLCPTHCTQHKAETKSLYPKKYIDGEVRKIIEV